MVNKIPKGLKKSKDYIGVGLNGVLVKQNCNTNPKRSIHTFLPRSKPVVEGVRSDGIIPEQDVIVNVSK